MSINLSNVKISLNEFQRLSKGEYNAGEVRLAGETKLTKMNNHVGSFFINNEIISHDEVLAIKQALVKALSENGVGGDALARVRQELGLAPADPADKSLHLRNLKPLTRQQIREILDRNATAINTHNEQNGGKVHIRTSEELHPHGIDESKVQKRDAINASLDAKDRRIDVNVEIARFQAIVSDSADFIHDAAERKRIVSTARAMLTEFLQSCDYNPSADEPAVATLNLPRGQTLSVPAGVSQKAFVDRLEDIIVRFTKFSEMPDVNHEIVERYQGLKDGPEREAFWAELANDPDCGFKARALAVRALYSRGITDYATLSMPNRLEAEDALALAKALVAMPMNATADETRANPVFAEMAAKAPAEVDKTKWAYVPATSTAVYNRFVNYFMTVDPVKGQADTTLPGYKHLVETTIATIRSRLGEGAMRANACASDLLDSKRAQHELISAKQARTSVDSLREILLPSGLNVGAEYLVRHTLEDLIRAAGGNAALSQVATNAAKARIPELFTRLAAAENPAQVQDIFGEYQERLEDLAHFFCKTYALADGAVNRAKEQIAAGLGVEPGVLQDIDIAVVTAMGTDAGKLAHQIVIGETQLETDEQCEAAFKQLADDAAEAFLSQVRTADQLKLPLPVIGHIKIALLGVKHHDAIDLAVLATAAAKISTDELEKRLAQNASKDDIYSALKDIALQIAEATDSALEGRNDAGDDERSAVVDILANAVIRNKPALFANFNAFVSRDDVKAEFEDNMFNVDKDVNALKALTSCIDDMDINMQANIHNAYVQDIFGLKG